MFNLRKFRYSAVTQFIGLGNYSTHTIVQKAIDSMPLFRNDLGEWIAEQECEAIHEHLRTASVRKDGVSTF